jgi:hypothetical protein
MINLKKKVTLKRKVTLKNKEEQKLAYLNILNRQILRLARIYQSRKVTVQSSAWHQRVCSMQCDVILEKHRILRQPNSVTVQELVFRGMINTNSHE